MRPTVPTASLANPKFAQSVQQVRLRRRVQRRHLRPGSVARTCFATFFCAYIVATCCMIFCMTKEQIDAVLESVRSWPQQDQEELVELAREIEARRTGVYIMNDEERAAVREGLDQARRGEFVPDDEMNAFWKKYDVL